MTFKHLALAMLLTTPAFADEAPPLLQAETATLKPASRVRHSGLDSVALRSLSSADIEQARKAKADKSFIVALENKLSLAEKARKVKEEDPAKGTSTSSGPSRWVMIKIGEQFRLGEIIGFSGYSQAGSTAWFTVKAKDAKGTFDINVGNYAYGYWGKSPANASQRDLVLQYYQLFRQPNDYLLSFVRSVGTVSLDQLPGGSLWWNAAAETTGNGENDLHMEFLPLD